MSFIVSSNPIYQNQHIEFLRYCGIEPIVSGYASSVKSAFSMLTDNNTVIVATSFSAMPASPLLLRLNIEPKQPVNLSLLTLSGSSKPCADEFSDYYCEKIKEYYDTE